MAAKTNDIEQKSSTGNFFAVDRLQWEKVCSLGLNEGITYLVQARGSARDNKKTGWSVHAVESYTGISRGRAGKAVKSLCKSGLVKKTKGGTRPRYELVPSNENDKPELIWLPNTIVDGAANETPPIELIRQTQDIELLRHFVNLYHFQILTEDGGLPRELIFDKFDRLKIGQRGPFDIYGFAYGAGDPAVRGSRFEALFGKKEDAAEIDENVKRIENLVRLGLIEIVPHLVESIDPDSEIIMPCSILSDIQLEHDLAYTSHEAARRMITDEQYSFAESKMPHVSLVPIPRHLSRVEMAGIYRLRYRPRTKLTAAWYSDYHYRYKMALGTFVCLMIHAPETDE